MSFTALDILSEFSEAARYGRFDIFAEADRALERRSARHAAQMKVYRRHYERMETLRSKARRVTYAIESLPVVARTCPRCGAPCELRAGTNRLVHLKEVRRA